MSHTASTGHAQYCVPNLKCIASYVPRIIIIIIIIIIIVIVVVVISEKLPG